MIKRSLARLGLVTALLAQPLPVAPTLAQAPAGLRAGAARVDITPAVADLPKPFTGIDSQLYVRALVLDSGGRRAVLVVGDLPTIAADVLDDLVKRIGSEANAPVENVLLAVTHTHNAVRLDNNPVGIILPGSAKITGITATAILASVKQAVAALQPARAGYGTGVFHLAGARMEPGTPAEGGQAQASDRTLGVFKVESTAGEPIALLVNGGPEPVMAGNSMKAMISADVAGVVERYVEQRFGDKPVVLYTVGSPPGVVVGGGGGRNPIAHATPADPKALMNAVGTVLGEEVLQAQARVTTSDVLPISGVLQVLNCPGKATFPLNNPGSCSDAPGATLPRCVFTDRDTAPVPLRFGVLKLGDLALVQSDANILPNVWAKVRGGSPAPAGTMLVALGYGPVHYVVDDADYPSNSYPVTASMVKRGCAATGFVDSTLRMLRQGTGRPG